MILEDEGNPEQQTLHRAVVGTPLGLPYPTSEMLSVSERGFLLQGVAGKKGKTVLETGYVPLPHLLPRTFRRKHLPPYTHSDTQMHNSSPPSVHTKEVNPVSEDKRFPWRRGSWQG